MEFISRYYKNSSSSKTYHKIYYSDHKGDNWARIMKAFVFYF